MPESFIYALSILGAIVLLTALISLPRRKPHPARRLAAEVGWHSPMSDSLPASNPQLTTPHLSPVPFHSLSTGVALPIVIALISALVLALAISVLALLFSLPVKTAGQLFAGVFVTTLACVWFAALALVRRDWRNTVHRLERITGADLDQDGRIGSPAELFRVEITDRSDPATWHRQIVDLPASENQVLQFARLVHAGRGLQESLWIGPGQPFSQAGYRRFIAYLRQKGMIVPVNDKSLNQGYQLSPAGRALISRLANSPTPPESPHV